MRVEILGSLQVRDDGCERSVGSGRQRALLAVLVLHNGELVSSERLVDALWGERPPATAAKALQGYVSQLRRSLSAEAIETRGSGYALRDAETDVAEFERLLDRSRGEQPRDAAATLRTALALWRGPPLVDVEYELWAQPEIARLEDLRLAALDARIAADLELGDHARVVSELESLVVEHPLRERLHTQLMLALYRCGRQADALEVYALVRARLVDELGIEPGPELQALQRGILEQDPVLAAPPERRVAALARHAPWLLVGGGLLLAASAAAAAVLLTRGGSRPILLAPNSIGAIDPSSNEVVGAIPVGDTPTSVAVGGGSVWVLNASEETISQVDAQRRAVVKTFGSGRNPIALALGDRALWVAAQARTLVRIDPSTYLSTTVRVPGDGLSRTIAITPGWVAADARSVWALNDAVVSRVAPAPQLVFRGRGLACCGALALGGGSVWTTDASGLERIDARTGSLLAHVGLPFTSATVQAPIAFGAGSAWIADESGNAVWRIDARSDAVIATLAVGSHPSGIAVGAGAIWVAGADGTVSRIDPNAGQGLGRVVRTIRVGGTPSSIAVGAGLVWVTVD
jgi:DNA-binding SARP family transcriptional activator/DNA-binding beta-propeller fold protein YncE